MSENSVRSENENKPFVVNLFFIASLSDSHKKITDGSNKCKFWGELIGKK